MPRNNGSQQQGREWALATARRVAARRVTLDINQVTFGIEIECTVPRDWARLVGLTVGYHSQGNLVPGSFPRGWRAASDGSISVQEQGHIAVEFVSPILKGTEGLAQVEEVVKLLEAAGAAVNYSTGCHVHVGVQSILGDRANDFEMVASYIGRLVALVSRHELALTALGGTKTRFGNSYCVSIKEQWKDYRFHIKHLSALRRYFDRADRYHVLNVTNIFAAKRTVEFRVFAGTMNSRKVIGYIRTALALCHRAADKPRAVPFEDLSYDPADLREVDFEAKLERLWKDLRGYGWPDGAAPRWWEVVKWAQSWNVRKAQGEIRGHVR